MRCLEPDDVLSVLSLSAVRTRAEPEPWRSAWWTSGAERTRLPGFERDGERRPRRGRR